MNTAEKVEDKLWMRKMFIEAFDSMKLGFFNYQRGNILTFELEPELTAEQIEVIHSIAKDYAFIDYTDKQKELIKREYADHPIGQSLCCGVGWFNPATD